MNKKDLLAQATAKLAAHSPNTEIPPPAVAQPVAVPSSQRENPQKASSPQKPKKRPPAAEKLSSNRKTREDDRTQKKGITLRGSNLKKLDELELSLRKQKVKANHSGLIQIAIDALEDGPELVKLYRQHLKHDLRFK